MTPQLIAVESDEYDALVSLSCTPLFKDGLMILEIDAELVIAIDKQGKTVEP